MDVKIIFINGKEIYVEQPKGLVIPVQEHKVFKLMKSLLD
jgi:hypothetical protein